MLAQLACAVKHDCGTRQRLLQDAPVVASKAKSYTYMDFNDGYVPQSSYMGLLGHSPNSGV